jgi:ATP-dependent helicase/nuclease subunit A
MPDTITRLFSSPLGQQMLCAKELIREFKFSILTDAKDYYPDISGEQVLLQGVVDAAILEEDGLTVIDFKTDRVSGDGVAQRAEQYRGQLKTYQKALARIFKQPVKKMVLYFLLPGKEVVL